MVCVYSLFGGWTLDGHEESRLSTRRHSRKRTEINVVSLQEAEESIVASQLFCSRSVKLKGVLPITSMISISI